MLSPAPLQQFQQLPGVDDLRFLMGRLEVLGVFGDDVVSLGSLRTLVDAVIVVVAGDFQPMTRQDSDADSFQQASKFGNPAWVKVLEVAIGEYAWYSSDSTSERTA